MRMKFADAGSDAQKGDDAVDRTQGAARAISSFIDPGLCWDDMAWFKSITSMPLILKGVQTWEVGDSLTRTGAASNDHV